MARLVRRINDKLESLVPEKRLYLQSHTATRYVRLTPLTQLGLGALALAGAAWTAVASASVALSLVYADARDSQADALEGAYRDRLTELAEERDLRASEAYSAQNRFRIAMDQLGRQQGHLLDAVEENRELATALDLMQSRLQSAVDARDALRREADELRAEVEATSETLAERSGSRADLAATLQTVSGALAEAARVRDRTAADRASLTRQVAELELEMQLNARRHDEMIAELEQAVKMSLGPLAEMFETAALDPESLIAKVRSDFSGQGGPLVSVSTRSYQDGGLPSRLDNLMIDLDRVNLLRIAAAGVPFTMPVSGSYRFTSGFGYRRDPKGGGRRMHAGIDLAGARGTPIHATADGVVETARREGGYGNLVRIRHAFGFETVYAHQHTLRVKPGQQVSRGDHIGDMGTTGRSTGVHLHYEVHMNGRPVNPMTYLEAAKDVF